MHANVLIFAQKQDRNLKEKEQKSTLNSRNDFILQTER